MSECVYSSLYHVQVDMQVDPGCLSYYCKCRNVRGGFMFAVFALATSPQTQSHLEHFSITVIVTTVHGATMKLNPCQFKCIYSTVYRKL